MILNFIIYMFAAHLINLYMEISQHQEDILTDSISIILEEIDDELQQKGTSLAHISASTIVYFILKITIKVVRNYLKERRAVRNNDIND